MMGFTKKAGTAMIRVSTSTGSQVLRLLLRGCAVASTDISAFSCFVGRDSSAPPASTNTITVVGKRVPEPYASFLTLCAYLLKGCRASIHPVSDKRGSRKPSFVLCSHRARSMYNTTQDFFPGDRGCPFVPFAESRFPTLT